MHTNRKSRGVTKQEWLEAGLRAMEEAGAANLTVEGLARSLGIAKAGFYWHFENREDLLLQLLNHWLQQTTEVVTADENLLALAPAARLTKAAGMVLDNRLERYDMAIRQWALGYPAAARAVRKVNRVRLEFARDAFRELGFTGDELEMRAMLFICYQTWETPMFPEISRKRRRALMPKRIELLTGR